MRFMLTIYGDESQMATASEEQIGQVMEAYFAYDAELTGAGAKVAGEGLHPTAMAKTVQVNDGNTVATDGPFAETKEQLGGFYLIDVADEAAAIEWAAKVPAAYMGGKVEVRAVQVFEQP